MLAGRGEHVVGLHDLIELEAVRRYEAAHRGRRTVLGKIALLQQGP